MTSSIRPETRQEARARGRSQRLWAYVSQNAKESARDAYEKVHGEPAPPLFERWQWLTWPAPRHRQDGIRWKWRHHRLRRHMRAGGVLIVVGPTRSGKTCLIERLGLRKIENPLSVCQSDLTVGHEDAPPELFAIDETIRHLRDDVMVADSKQRGFALVFQSSESFRDYEIAAFLAWRNVLFVELQMD
ncbi:MAG: hypothetical protein QM605_07975 [Sphingobium sp.]